MCICTYRNHLKSIPFMIRFLLFTVCTVHDTCDYEILRSLFVAPGSSHQDEGQETERRTRSKMTPGSKEEGPDGRKTSFRLSSRSRLSNKTAGRTSTMDGRVGTSLGRAGSSGRTGTSLGMRGPYMPGQGNRYLFSNSVL